MKLSELAHARAGDKGDTSDITVIANRPEDYELLSRQLTAALVAAHFADTIGGDVRRYEVPQLGALKFVLEHALGGGVTRSLNLDSHGKSFGSLILEIELPDDPHGGASDA